MATVEKPTREKSSLSANESYKSDLQQILHRAALGEIGEEETLALLEEVLERSHDEPWLRKVLRALLPSLSRYRARVSAG